MEKTSDKKGRGLKIYFLHYMISERPLAPTWIQNCDESTEMLTKPLLSVNLF